MTTLYHFTSRWVLPKILREGINRGDVPIRPGVNWPEEGHGFSAPWLTDDPSWENQRGWTEFSILDKREVRLTVEIPEGAKNLVTWQWICEEYEVPEYWRIALETKGLRESGLYVYLTGIPTKWIKKVEIREGLSPLNALALPPNFHFLCNNHNSPAKPGPSKWKVITRTAFIRDAGNWIRSPNMSFPWSDMPVPLLRTLANANPNVAAQAGAAFCEKSGINLFLESTRKQVPALLPALLTMSGVSRWLNSKRMIIDISRQSCELLTAWEERFEGLPVVFGRAPWHKGVMFRVIYDAPGEEPAPLKIMMYMEPLEGEQAGVRFCVWVQGIHRRWCTVLPHPLLVGGTVSDLDTYTRMDRMLRTKPGLAIMEDGTRLDLGRLRRAGINAMAAIYADPTIVLGSRKAPRKNRSKRAGPVNKVRRLTLSYDGARLVTRRWVILPTEPQTEKIEHAPHKTPCEHQVQPHQWRVWVNTPKVHEKVLGTRTKQRKKKDGTIFTYTQYRVSRLRGKNGAFTRGKGIEPRHARIVTGVTDLNMPGSGV